MSERGSFVTEYVYCAKCFEAIKPILLDDEKFLCSRILPSWEPGQLLPIIAGKIGGLYLGEELHTFDFELNEKISKVICHPIRIAVLAETGEQIFLIKPITKEEIEAERVRAETLYPPDEPFSIEEAIKTTEEDIVKEEENFKKAQSIFTIPPIGEKKEIDGEQLRKEFYAIFSDGFGKWTVSPKIAFEWLSAKIKHEART
ncbi:MAG: hypothetical protein US15_C0073G0007 [Candidatus Moranbacteria bacterium GW2011_GWF1_36_4]|nr:MAG: hypothetical protein US15_C0073G0007 [Candidatus Moranbacteria bacterium GW2011_GWF1_36_4]